MYVIKWWTFLIAFSHWPWICRLKKVQPSLHLIDQQEMPTQGSKQHSLNSYPSLPCPKTILSPSSWLKRIHKRVLMEITTITLNLVKHSNTVTFKWVELHSWLFFRHWSSSAIILINAFWNHGQSCSIRIVYIRWIFDSNVSICKYWVLRRLVMSPNPQIEVFCLAIVHFSVHF